MSCLSLTNSSVKPMKPANRIQQGFTLIEVATVLLIVGILLGYTVALFPRQQELKQYRAVDAEMDRIMEALVGFAQVNGRLPCPSNPASGGNEDPGGDAECTHFGGFVPVNTLGLTGRLNQDALLMDPWGNPYRYYVSASNFLAAEQVPISSGPGKCAMSAWLTPMLTPILTLTDSLSSVIRPMRP